MPCQEPTDADPRSAVDITNEPGEELRTDDNVEGVLGQDPSSRDDVSNIADEERAFTKRVSRSRFHRTNGNSEASRSDETELQTRSGSITPDSSSFVKRKTSQFLDVLRGGQQRGSAALSPQLATLVDAYAASEIAASIKSEVDAQAQRRPEEQLPDVAEENRLLRGRRGASWLTQFRILSGRAFKNLYRDPALLMAHYVSSIVLACKHLHPYVRLVLTYLYWQ